MSNMLCLCIIFLVLCTLLRCPQARQRAAPPGPTAAAAVAQGGAGPPGPSVGLGAWAPRLLQSPKHLNKVWALPTHDKPLHASSHATMSSASQITSPMTNRYEHNAAYQIRETQKVQIHKICKSNLCYVLGPGVRGCPGCEGWAARMGLGGRSLDGDISWRWDWKSG